MSATYVLLFVALLVAMGTLHASVSNSIEEVRAAQQFQNDDIARVQGTDVNVTEVKIVDTLSCEVTVTANNTGTTVLTVSDTDLFTDGTYDENISEQSTVDGNGDTDLWLPGQQLEIDVGELLSAPDRVKIVSGPGVADTTGVSGLLC